MLLSMSEWEEVDIQTRVELPVIPRDTCQKALGTTEMGEDFQLDQSFICVGGEVGQDVCNVCIVISLNKISSIL